MQPDQTPYQPRLPFRFPQNPRKIKPVRVFSGCLVFRPPGPPDWRLQVSIPAAGRGGGKGSPPTPPDPPPPLSVF